MTQKLIVSWDVTAVEQCDAKARASTSVGENVETAAHLENTMSVLNEESGTAMSCLQLSLPLSDIIQRHIPPIAGLEAHCEWMASSV